MTDSHIRAALNGVQLYVNGRIYRKWISLEASQDLAFIAGTFRADIAVAFPVDPDEIVPAVGDKIAIHIEGFTVLRGWIEAVNSTADEKSCHVTISGRDVTGDLVDCAANPLGPAEYRQIKLETLVGNLAQPFQISVDRQVETGTPFTLVALEPHDTALGAIENHARQRGVLVRSDGVGKIILTKAGTTHAGDSLVFPGGNVKRAEVRHMQRHSDHFVKGQFHSLKRGTAPALHAGSIPGQNAVNPAASQNEAAANCRFGHSCDLGVKRYRPAVYLSKTQSGGSVAVQNTVNPLAGLKPKKPRKRHEAEPWSLTDQAEWRMRSTRAHASAFLYTVPGFLNKQGELWRPNQLVTVKDRLNGVDGDMLIAAVTWVISNSGSETRISVVPPDAFDLEGAAVKMPQYGQRQRNKSEVRSR